MKVVGISGPIKASGQKKVLDALGTVYDIQFEERIFGDDKGLSAWLILEGDCSTIRQSTSCDLSCYIVVKSDELILCGESDEVIFSSESFLPRVLIGRKVYTIETSGAKGLPNWIEGITVLSRKEEGALWGIRILKGKEHHYSALTIPELNEDEPLFHCFNGQKFMALLPLIFFLRTLNDYRSWDPPPLQACFMFDDPNLHWKRYGFIDFAKIAKDSAANNYHVSFAMVPIDGWFVHKPTALMFRKHAENMSLLIHGNDHIARELGRPCSSNEINRILEQSLGRIQAFERSSGLKVSRVMAPPHGACTEAFLHGMARCGFEAICVSRGSLYQYNRDAAWAQKYGMRPSEDVGGLTVFPRFRLSRNCHNSILVAAILNQAIIPVGHHHDLAEGVDMLQMLSGFINSLGGVKWTNLKRMSRGHYATKSDGKTLMVKTFSRRIDVPVPEGINEITLVLPGAEGSENRSLGWRLVGEMSKWGMQMPEEPIPVLPGQRVEIVIKDIVCKSPEKALFSRTRLWPVTRRQLTEIRDRLAPLIRRISGKHWKA